MLEKETQICGELLCKSLEASLDCLTQFINWLVRQSFVRQLFVIQSMEKAVEKEQKRKGGKSEELSEF